MILIQRLTANQTGSRIVVNALTSTLLLVLEASQVCCVRQLKLSAFGIITRVVTSSTDAFVFLHLFCFPILLKLGQCNASRNFSNFFSKFVFYLNFLVFLFGFSRLLRFQFSCRLLLHSNLQFRNLELMFLLLSHHCILFLFSL